MNYQFLLSKNRKTPQNQPIPGREAEMVQGRSGGWMFQADSWSVLRRCLLIGTAQSTFYADQHELTTEFVAVLNQAIALDPDRVAQEILYASDGHALNNSAPILALVLLSMGESPPGQARLSGNIPPGGAHRQPFLRVAELHQGSAGIWQGRARGGESVAGPRGRAGAGLPVAEIPAAPRLSPSGCPAVVSREAADR